MYKNDINVLEDFKLYISERPFYSKVLKEKMLSSN